MVLAVFATRCQVFFRVFSVSPDAAVLSRSSEKPLFFKSSAADALSYVIGPLSKKTRSSPDMLDV